jgi:small-conductance mechanosensitive channel
MKKIVIAFILLLAANAAPADEAELQSPNPLRLASDWWSYFEPVKEINTETLNKRIEETHAKLDTLLSQFQGETAVAALVTQLKQQLDIFKRVKSAEPPAEKSLPPVLDTYTLTQAVQTFTEWHNLKQQYDTTKEEYEWRSAVISAEGKQQSRRRNQYLESEKTDPKRLVMGLELMVSRFALELKRLELERQSAIMQGLEKQRESRAQELDIIPKRLSVPQAEGELWSTAYAQAQSAITQRQKQSEQVRVDAFGAQGAPQELMQSRYSVLLDVKRNIEISVLQLKAAQASLALSLIKLLTEKTATDTTETRSTLANYENLESTIKQNLIVWQKAAERVKRYSLELSVDKTKPDPKLLALQQTAQELAISTDQALRELAQQRAATGYIYDLLHNKLELTEGWFQRGVKDTSHATKQVWQVTLNLLGETLFEINETPVTILGLIRIVVILAVAWWLSKGIRKALHRIGERRAGVNKSSLYTLGRIVHYIVLILGVIIGLSSIGIDFTKFALFASALGVGIGFGLQTLISNFVAGLIILFERSLKVGDFVELESGVTGIVNEINMRSTLITTNDNIDILVPNSEFVGGRVTNWTLREAHRRIRVPFGVAYGTDKDKVKQAVLEAADKVKWTLKGKPARIPQVWFVEFGDSSLNFELVVWLTPEAVKRPAAVQAAYLWEIETELTKNGIEIPFPQRDLHLRSMFGHKDEAGLAVLQETLKSQVKMPL